MKFTNAALKGSGCHQPFLFIIWFYFADNILEDKPDVKSPADKEEQPTDDVPKKMKKADMMQSKGKVGSQTVEQKICIFLFLYINLLFCW